MIEISHSFQVNRSPADVFAYITDPSKAKEFDPELESSEMLTPEPMGKGSRIKETRKFLGRELVSEIEVTAYDPNRLVAMEVKEGPVPFEIRYELTEAGGGTQVDIRAQGEPGGFFKLAQGMVKKQLQSSIEATSGLVKQNLEG